MNQDWDYIMNMTTEEEDEDDYLYTCSVCGSYTDAAPSSVDDLCFHCMDHFTKPTNCNKHNKFVFPLRQVLKQLDYPINGRSIAHDIYNGTLFVTQEKTALSGGYDSFLYRRFVYPTTTCSVCEKVSSTEPCYVLDKATNFLCCRNCIENSECSKLDCATSHRLLHYVLKKKI
jgi:hypothetical protein